MKDNRFTEGQLIKSIFWDECGCTESGKSGCKRITVVMENGQMAGVPWFLVEYENSEPQKFNAAKVEGVTLFGANK